jgi:uncharacterized membrane protein
MEAQTLALVAAIHLALMITLIVLLTPSLIITLGLIVANVVWVALFGVYLSSKQWPVIVEAAVETISFALPLIMVAVLIYAPFYRGFTSQASGLLPVVTREGITEAGTRPLHAFLYWGPLFAAVVPFVIARLLLARDRITRREVLIAAAVPVVIIVGWALWFGYTRLTNNEDVEAANGFFTQIKDRETAWITALVFGAILSASLLALWKELVAQREGGERVPVIFALLAATTAFLLILGTEFYYVGDLFSVRMNTVFKLYYQAWLLLALAGGFAIYYLVSTWRAPERETRILNQVWAGTAAVLIAATLLYTFGATLNRTRPYDGDGQQAVRHREIDGLDGLARLPAGERAAIATLRGLAKGQDIVIAEAAGGSYSDAGRIAAATGAPSVLGWPGHEDQWRGGSAEARAGRFEDLERMWRATSIDDVRPIVDRYGITYIYVGDLERRTYGGVAGALEKFSEFPVAFQTESVIVYKAEGTQQAEASTSP